MIFVVVEPAWCSADDPAADNPDSKTLFPSVLNFIFVYAEGSG